MCLTIFINKLGEQQDFVLLDTNPLYNNGDADWTCKDKYILYKKGYASRFFKRSVLVNTNDKRYHQYVRGIFAPKPISILFCKKEKQ